MTDLIPIQDIEKMARAISASKLFGIQTPDQAFALCLISQAEGRHPVLAARDYDIIQGRPAKKSEAMLRDFLAGGGKVEWHELDDAQADATFAHPNGGSVRIAWDIERAKQAGLAAKDMWKKYPRQMLRARCISEGVRTVYPAATSGMYVPEEAADIPQKEKDMGAAVVVPTVHVKDPLDEQQQHLAEALIGALTDCSAAELPELRKQIQAIQSKNLRIRGINAYNARAKTLKDMAQAHSQTNGDADVEV